MWNAFSVPISPAPSTVWPIVMNAGMSGASGPSVARHRADVRHRHRLRRHVAGVPVVLVPRVQDEAEIGGLERADHRAAIDDAADALEPLRELDVIDGRVDRRERAEHVADRHARRERRVALRIERLGLRHAAGHPQHDDRVGGRRAVAARRAGRAGSRQQRRQRACGGAEECRRRSRAHDSPRAADALSVRSWRVYRHRRCCPCRQ